MYSVHNEGKSVISNINGEKILETFFEKELQKANQKAFRVEKVIKKIDNGQYVNMLSYDKSFNSWIDKKYI